MPDYSVYVTVVNKTSEDLSNGYSHASHGTWYRFPSWVSAGHTENFQLQDAKGWWFGSEGSFRYDLTGHGGSTSMFSTYQRDPWTENDQINKVDITDHPGPLSVYESYFRAKSGDQQDYGRKNQYPTGGHPLYVEYTIDYTTPYKRTLKFKLTRINAISTHPVRNSDDRLISGNHIVWDSSNPSSYKDGIRGSKEANVFGYRFGSAVKDTGILSVTLHALDSELSGLAAYLTGTRPGDAKVIFKSDVFTFPSSYYNDVTATARVVDRQTSDQPFCIDGDIDWGVTLVQTQKALTRDGEGVSRLELYWIAETRHTAFQQYFPIIFMRPFFESSGSRQTPVLAIRDNWSIDCTRRAFSAFNKKYDVISGKLHFFYYSYIVC
ncbi:hypothetical protein H0H87_002050 [Tephrocybe sp. NHM501043]|nr:hypothetical protein H0H87_002050 [Tephrocybe sp. NHM501043]